VRQLKAQEMSYSKKKNNCLPDDAISSNSLDICPVISDESFSVNNR